MKSKKKGAKITVKKVKRRARASPRQNVSPVMKIEKKTENDKKPKDSKAMLIAQEVKFARLLASNDKKVRDKVLKNLKKWFMVRSQSSYEFTEADFMRVWKGLFYCMWMSDKPLVQEDLAESLSKLVHCFNSMDTALLYTKCTLKSLATEWFGIDRYRVDKFEMLVRKILRQTFEMCKKQSWNKQWAVGVGKVIEEILVDPKTCLGLNLHITEIYMEELAKISEGKIPKSILTEFIKPHIIHLASSDDERQIKHIVKNILRYLIFQSDVGMDYSEKFQAWREAGFPCQSIDEIQKIEVLDNEEEEDEESNSEVDREDINEVTNEKPLDPRAGRVDVEIPQLPFDPVQIVALLRENKFHKSSTTRTRKCITRLINDFDKLTQGEMPFGIKELPVPDTTRISSYEAAEDLLRLDQELYSDSSKNNRKRRKNGDLEELEQENDGIEELIAPQVHQNLSTKSSNKKQKFFSENEEYKKIDSETKSKKSIKQKSKVKLSEKKKRKLNVSDPLNKKSMKSSKKLTSTFSECSIKPETTDDIVKLSTSSNWDIDAPASPTHTLSSSVKVIEKTKKPKNKKLVLEKSTGENFLKSEPQKKTTKKKKVSLEKETDDDLLKNDIPWLTPVLTRLEEQNKVPTSKKSAQKQTPTSSKAVQKQTPKTDSLKKRVKIMLQRNTAQNTSEYFRQLRQSPAIPFDANRKPKAGVLKPSPLPSPVNPFYKRKIF